MPKRTQVSLTARDYAILQSLSQGRYLPIPCVEWLHFPQWRERYAVWQAEQAAGSERRYKACTQAYTRMQQLCAAGLVGHIVRPVAQAVNVYHREADLFFLTEAGALALTAHSGVPLSALHYREPRERSYLMLQHHATVGRAYAALRSRIEGKPGLSFSDWRSEHDFQRDHDRISVYTPQGEDGGTEEQGIQPDGAFFIEHEGGRALFFVEVERDQPVMKWKQKVWAYEAYHGSAQLQARFQHPTFALLGIVENASRQRSLIQATAEALVALYPYNAERRESAMRRYEITTVERLHPATVGAGWFKLAAVRPVERKAIGGAVRYGAEIEGAEHVLIK